MQVICLLLLQSKRMNYLRVLSLFDRGFYWEERQKMYSLQDDDESLMGNTK